MDDRRYFMIGALIYALVSALWIGIAFAVSGLTVPLVGIALALLALLLAAAIVKFRHVGASVPLGHQSTVAGKWFGIIFATEGALIGIGSGCLLA